MKPSHRRSDAPAAHIPCIARLRAQRSDSARVSSRACSVWRGADSVRCGSRSMSVTPGRRTARASIVTWRAECRGQRSARAVVPSAHSGKGARASDALAGYGTPVQVDRRRTFCQTPAAWSELCPRAGPLRRVPRRAPRAAALCERFMTVMREFRPSEMAPGVGQRSRRAAKERECPRRPGRARTRVAELEWLPTRRSCRSAAYTWSTTARASPHTSADVPEPIQPPARVYPPGGLHRARVGLWPRISCSPRIIESSPAATRQQVAHGGLVRARIADVDDVMWAASRAPARTGTGEAARHPCSRGPHTA
jgi:hypothetical protein